MVKCINNPCNSNFSHKIYIGILLIVVLAFTRLNAQSQLTFQNYTTSNGLTNNTVWDILQDTSGYIWIATNEGVNKFDGYSFQKYLYFQEDTVKKQAVRVLAEDNYHNIWAGTWGGGIYIYNATIDKFRHISLASDSSKYNYNFIHDLHLDKSGNMWVGTVGGLIKFNTNDFSFSYFQQSVPGLENTDNYYVYSITEDEEGMIWVGASEVGLLRINAKNESIEKYNFQSDITNNVNDFVTSVYHDSKGRLWIGTFEEGLNLLEKGKNEFINYQFDPDNDNSLPHNQIENIIEDKEGNIWIATDNGLSLFNEEENNFFNFKNDPYDNLSISSNSIKCVFVDNHNRLWVGTYKTGVNLSNMHSKYINYYYQQRGNNSLSHNLVAAFVELDSNNILIGTDGGGLNWFNRSTNEFIHFLHDKHNPTSIASNKVIALSEGQNEDIWIGFWNGGMDRFDLKTRTFEHFNSNVADPANKLPGNSITSIVNDKEGLLWIGAFGEGLFSFDPVSKKLEAHVPESSKSERMVYDNVWCLLADSNDNIWVGSHEGYIYKLNRKDNSFEYILPRPTEVQGFITIELFEDHLGQVWTGLEGGGLRLLNDADQLYPVYTTADGLPGNTVQSIEETPDGKLWLGTDEGIAEFDPQTKTFRNNRLNEGQHKLIPSRQASKLLSTGELAFGGTNGFIIFHPDSLKDIRNDSQIMLTNFEIFNQPVQIGAENSPLNKHINYVDTITLSYNHSVFSISYTGINFIDPSLIKYRYRLLGFIDESWQNVGFERKVTYTNLQPRKYVFEVEGEINGEKIPSRTLHIIVLPPWWATTWFRLLALAIFSLFLYGIYWYRLRSIRKQNRILAIKVNERTKRLQVANEELRQKNYFIQEQKEEIQAQAEELEDYTKEIHLINEKLEETVVKRTAWLKKSNEELDNFVYRVSHDIRAPLSSILGLISLIKMETMPLKIEEYVNMVSQSINKLDTFVKNILDYSRNSRLKVEPEEINFTKLLNDILEELKYMQHAERLELIREFNIEENFYNDALRLQVIFRNLISNAIKYQNPYEDHSYAKVKISVNAQELNLEVEDNGIGIRKDDQLRIFDMFFRSDNRTAGSGLGLYIVKESIEKLGGSISLDSQVHKGTTFKIKLPNLIGTYKSKVEV
ncbi:MAG: hypothetical protein CMO01_33480 [Thalassobius sp.]|nr:hypothetical protein [Thalassovita sp.]